MYSIMLFFIDSIVGIYLIYFEKIPTLQEGLKDKTNLVGHPYKSYILKPGNIMNKGLSVVNDYGHQVLHEDINIAYNQKKDNEYRILFLGGSTTFQPWPFYLAQILNKKSHVRKKFKAINAGTGGYTSQENLIDLIICGFSYQPDMVIAYLPVNDIWWSSMYPDFKRDYTHMRIPAKTIAQSATKPDIRSIPHYPFIYKYIKTLQYKEKFNSYIKKADITTYVNKQPIPWPKPPNYVNADVSFEDTVKAIVENIYNMNILCKKRNIKFILITQKLFPYPYGYDKPNYYAELMDYLTLEAIERIKNSEEINSIYLLEMQKIFPNEWSNEMINLVKSYFPNKKINFSEKMAYDNMHFNNASLHLFSIFLFQYLQDGID